MKMKGLGRDLTSARASDHGGERDPATEVDALEIADDNMEDLDLI